MNLNLGEADSDLGEGNGVLEGQFGGGRNPHRWDGVSLGPGVGHWGDSGDSLDLHGLCSANSNNWGSVVDLGDGVGRGSSHNGLVDTVRKTLLVPILEEAL